jgi:tetratricopeptide (TPR) repeat protein
MALIRRAWETSDDGFYTQAGDAVRKSLEISPANFDARKMAVLVLLGRNDYPAALTGAKALNKKIADDIMVYGLLTEAYSALGDYKNAEIAAQWMLNLRPGNTPAFVHAAELREVFGDFDGSYEALDLAYQSTSPTEYTDRAALLTHMGCERRLAQKNDDAEKLLKQALGLFPGYPAALAELAAVYLNQKRADDAVLLLRQLYKIVPTAQNAYRLAEALEKSGRTEEAQSSYADFLSKALPESANRKNSNLELIFYYADHARQPAKALELASGEFAWRKDIFTIDAYSWALHVNGREQEARKQMEVALAVGTRDPKILAHADAMKVSISRSAAKQ